MQKRAISILLDNYETIYSAQLLNKEGRSSMSINILRMLYVETYKSLNELNPNLIRNIFTVKEANRLTREQY